MRIIVSILLILVIALSITTYKLAIREPKTFVMCVNTEMTDVRAKPSNSSQIMYVLSKHDKIWWSGSRTELWLFVDYAHGSGWISSSTDLGECLPDKPWSIFDPSSIQG